MNKLTRIEFAKDHICRGESKYFDGSQDKLIRIEYTNKGPQTNKFRGGYSGWLWDGQLL